MKKKPLMVGLWVIMLAIGPCVTQGVCADNEYFTIAPGFSAAWYPYADFSDYVGAPIETGYNNWGLSAMMNLALFQRVSASIDFGISDPTLKKLMKFAGYLSAYNFMIKYDYHAYNGKATGKGSPPDNPLPDGPKNFDASMTDISLMYRFDSSIFSDPVMMWAVGLFYANFNTWTGYQGLSPLQDGFGKITGTAWGVSMLLDSIPLSMGLADSDGYIDFCDGLEFFDNGTYALHAWVYGYMLLGAIPAGSGSLDKKVVQDMADRGGIPLEDTDFKKNPGGTYAKISVILGFLNRWELGPVHIGLAIGAELLWEQFSIKTKKDIAAEVNVWNIGPVARLTVRY